MNRFIDLTTEQIKQKFSVNIPGALEVLWQPFYDMQVYAAAGQTIMTFFQNPVGQAGRTLFDTNMQTAGVFPSMQNFLATGIQLEFQPGVLTTDADYPLDVRAVSYGGYVEFNVGNKNFNRDAPVGKYPPQYRLDFFSSLDASAAPAQSNYAQARGAYYEITPTMIPSNQNFNVTINWPAAVPVSAAGTIRCTLDGYLIRAAQ